MCLVTKASLCADSCQQLLAGLSIRILHVGLQVTALEIQALKRIDKSSQVLLLDKGGSGPAKAVAKELSRLGFRSVFIVNGGFTAWAQSKLQIRRPVCPMKIPWSLHIFCSRLMTHTITYEDYGATLDLQLHFREVVLEQ